MNPLVLLALTWLPHFGGSAQFSHDLNTNDDLRGDISLNVNFGIARTESWRMNGFTSVRSMIRDNNRRETVFRISPQQVHYPVGLRLRWRLTDNSEWGLIAYHQSNHDVDTSDADLNRETISFEIYGFEWANRSTMVRLGLYYDRGTRLDGTLQNWPFNYYLAGATVCGEWPIIGDWFIGGRLTGIGHLNNQTPIPYLTVGGHAEVGIRFLGARGEFRILSRVTRLTDYPYLGATPQHILALGLDIRSKGFSPGRIRRNDRSTKRTALR